MQLDAYTCNAEQAALHRDGECESVCVCVIPRMTPITPSPSHHHASTSAAPRGRASSSPPSLPSRKPARPMRAAPTQEWELEQKKSSSHRPVIRENLAWVGSLFEKETHAPRAHGNFRDLNFPCSFFVRANGHAHHADGNKPRAEGYGCLARYLNTIKNRGIRPAKKSGRKEARLRLWFLFHGSHSPSITKKETVPKPWNNKQVEGENRRPHAQIALRLKTHSRLPSTQVGSADLQEKGPRFTPFARIR